MSALDKSLQRNRLVFGACVVVVLIVVVGLVGYNLWRLRVATIESQLDAVAQDAGAFEEHLTQTLSVIDLNLVSLAEQSAHDAARVLYKDWHEVVTPKKPTLGIPEGPYLACASDYALALIRSA